jgi:hypothetical protein
VRNLQNSLLTSTYVGLNPDDGDGDPDVSEYGPGVAIYFDMMLKLLHIFILMSIISVPMLLLYGLQGGTNEFSY